METSQKNISRSCVWRCFVLIFVTVGADFHPFDRLIKKVDEIVKKGRIKDEFFVQLGNSEYTPRYIKNFVRFMKEKEHEDTIRKADLVITHAGLGNIMKSLGEEKPLIIVPRRKKFGEHIDDHQLDLARYFENKRGCRVLYDLKGLETAIDELKHKKIRKGRIKKARIFKMIKDFVENNLKY